MERRRQAGDKNHAEYQRYEDAKVSIRLFPSLHMSKPSFCFNDSKDGAPGVAVSRLHGSRCCPDPSRHNLSTDLHWQRWVGAQNQLGWARILLETGARDVRHQVCVGLGAIYQRLGIGLTAPYFWRPMSSLFSTDKIANTKRFSLWRDMLCGTHASLDCQRLSPRPFSGASESAQVDRVVLTHLHSVDQKIVWTPVRNSTDDGALLVTLQTLGLGVLIQDGREARLGPGCISVHESGRPFTWVFPDEFEQLIVRIPRDSLAAKLCETRHLTARVINGTSGIGSLVSGFLHQTFAVLGNCSPSAAYHLSKISCDLIHTALSEFHGQEESQPCGQSALLHRAKQVIESNLHDPDLNPRRVAAKSRISLRYLQNLFKDENTTQPLGFGNAA